LRRRVSVEQPAGHLEAREAGHLDVEEHDIRPEPIDSRDRLESVVRLADHGDAAELAEQIAELVSRQLLVVDQYGAQIPSVTPSPARGAPAPGSPGWRRCPGRGRS